MVEKGASERLDEILIEGRDFIGERLAKIYKIKFREIEFEKHRITPRDYFTNTRKKSRDS